MTLNDQRNTTQDESDSTLTTPFAVQLGWLLIAFSIIPLLLGISDKMMVALAAGLGMFVGGVICIRVGRSDGRKRAGERGSSTSSPTSPNKT